eukprot:CAMPEP_0174386262 /NCGR_PEP_ID=MMETSP0811_2-20130205/127161_1 /TAXON_ID=73025 ORGANISM="Eutreptiella gymnastica-like, Strain CCMP1594" /NCGR_SAMPLE_ID=MMETSP0811_2 /ASSEMBLY_ACC=CAM_ASM_000667 /LENGTH=52 /DNA_ID=CAMNT_0015540877 /DNA_START=1088 /DNA_END=1243 /DNA_ORIENTATION=+
MTQSFPAPVAISYCNAVACPMSLPACLLHNDCFQFVNKNMLCRLGDVCSGVQ